jgi:predicted dithiol-disulfide oxidoreductase (DUF899 family)
MPKANTEAEQRERPCRYEHTPIVSPQEWEAARQQLLVKVNAHVRGRYDEHHDKEA